MLMSCAVPRCVVWALRACKTKPSENNPFSQWTWSIHWFMEGLIDDRSALLFFRKQQNFSSFFFFSRKVKWNCHFFVEEMVSPPAKYFIHTTLNLYFILSYSFNGCNCRSDNDISVLDIRRNYICLIRNKYLHSLTWYRPLNLLKTFISPPFHESSSVYTLVFMAFSSCLSHCQKGVWSRAQHRSYV